MDSKTIENFRQKKKSLIERLRNMRVENGMILEPEECLSVKNHLSRAGKNRFYAGATTLDPLYLSSCTRLGQRGFMEKTLSLALQDNGKMIP